MTNTPHAPRYRPVCIPGPNTPPAIPLGAEEREPTSPLGVPHVPPNCELIQLYVGQLKQLFNAMDPSPFREKDLDPSAEEFIVGWAREAPADAPLGLVVHLDRTAGIPEEPGVLREAIHEFFTHRGESSRRRLRHLFRVGRTSLAIGLVFLAVSIVAGELLAEALGEGRLADVLRESVLIGGWVAMWRPLEIFLYDWWPIRTETRLYERLSAMPVRINYRGEGTPDAWRADWPAVKPASGAVAERK